MRAQSRYVGGAPTCGPLKSESHSEEKQLDASQGEQACLAEPVGGHLGVQRSRIFSRLQDEPGVAAGVALATHQVLWVEDVEGKVASGPLLAGTSPAQ